MLTILLRNTIVVLLVLLLCSSNLLCFAQKAKVRIVDKGAELRLKPDSSSAAIKQLPLGTEFDVIETIGEWIKVKLPPDKDGMVIVGYINRSHVEIELMEVKTERETVVQEKRLPLREAQVSLDQNAIYDWENALRRAKSKRSTGTILTVTGAIVFTGCMILTFAHQEPEFDFPYYKYKARTPYIIGDVLGLVTLTTGLALLIPASGTIKRLNEEGRRKGYLSIGLSPEHKGISLRLIYCF